MLGATGNNPHKNMLVKLKLPVSSIVVEDGMRKTITAIVAASSIAATAIATSKPAEARCLGCWVGAGIAAGIVGGALASRSYGYGYSPYYYGYTPYAYAPAYYGGYAPAYYGGYYAPRRYYARRYYRY